MSDDVLSRIDATLEAVDESITRNARRFDPFGLGYDRPRPQEGRQRPKAASPFLLRQDITGRPDRIAEAFRGVVQRQGLDVDDISDTFVPLRVALRPDGDQVEALRPARVFIGPASTWEGMFGERPAIDTMSLECATGGPQRCRGCDGRTAGRGDRLCQHDCHTTPEQQLLELRRENAANWEAIRRTIAETEQVLVHIKQLPKPPARRPWWQWRPW